MKVYMIIIDMAPENNKNVFKRNNKKTILKNNCHICQGPVTMTVVKVTMILSLVSSFVLAFDRIHRLDRLTQLYDGLCRYSTVK